LDSNGRLLAWSDRLGRASESIKATLRAGEYYVQISSWLEAVSPYAFSASATPLAPVPSNPPPTPPIGQPADPTPPVAALPDVPYFGSLSEWNLNVINAPEPWAAGYTGEGVLVAVVDTGVDVNHPDLMSQLFVNAGEIAGNGIDDDGNGFIDDISGWDFVSSDNNADDGNGHGTHVAGTIAAANNGTGVTGVAPGAGQHMVGG
jgi:subtilisin family serine protease